MTTPDDPSLPPAHFHDESGAVRFWVPAAGGYVGASISRATLH